jgi:hypothetical protein
VVGAQQRQISPIKAFAVALAGQHGTQPKLSLEFLTLEPKAKCGATIQLLINDSAAGRIFELAGKKTPGNKLDTQLRKAGYGKPRRLVWKVVWENRERVKRNIYDALEEAKKTLQQHLDSQK